MAERSPLGKRPKVELEPAQKRSPRRFLNETENDSSSEEHDDISVSPSQATEVVSNFDSQPAIEVSKSAKSATASPSPITNKSMKMDDQSEVETEDGDAEVASDVVSEEAEDDREAERPLGRSLTAPAAAAPSSGPLSRSMTEGAVKRYGGKYLIRGHDIPKSAYRGVSWDRRMNAWRVKCMAVHVGFFPDEKEAALAFDRAKIKVFDAAQGKVLELNFPELASGVFPGVELRRVSNNKAEMAMGKVMEEGKGGQRPSRYRGVMWDLGTKSWRAKIKVKSRTWYLGVFADEEAAAKCYDRAAVHCLRPTSGLNFPDIDYSNMPLPRPPPNWVGEYIAEVREAESRMSYAHPEGIAKPESSSRSKTSTSGERNLPSQVSEPVRPPTTTTTTATTTTTTTTPTTADVEKATSEYPRFPLRNGDPKPAAALTSSSGLEMQQPKPRRRWSKRKDSPIEAQESDVDLPQMFYSPPKMRGVNAEPDGTHFQAHLQYYQHKLFLGRFPNVFEAMRAHDIACLKLYGVNVCKENDLLNAKSHTATRLANSRIPSSLEFLAKELLNVAPHIATTIADVAKTNASSRQDSSRVSMVQKALKDVRDLYRRRSRRNQDEEDDDEVDDRITDEDDDVATTSVADNRVPTFPHDHDGLAALSTMPGVGPQMREFEAMMRRSFATPQIPTGQTMWQTFGGTYNQFMAPPVVYFHPFPHPGALHPFATASSDIRTYPLQPSLDTASASLSSQVSTTADNVTSTNKSDDKPSSETIGESLGRAMNAFSKALKTLNESKNGGEHTN